MLIKKDLPHFCEDGFTLVEGMISLVIAGFGLLALVSTSDYFLKSNLAVESRGDFIKTQNLIATSLSMKSPLCTGRATGSVKNCCADHLRSVSGGPILVPGFSTSAPGPIRLEDTIGLSLRMGTGPNATSILRSGEERIREHLTYRVLLTGSYRARSKDSNASIYSGAIELSAERTSFITGAPMRARIPLEFEVDTFGTLTSCVVRPPGAMLAGNNSNTVNHCLNEGGTPVPTRIGNLCRFQSPLQINVAYLPCPPGGFIGNADPDIGCTVDPSAASPRIQKIPNCPAPSRQDPSSLQGSLFCIVEGPVPAPTPSVPPSPVPLAPPCPDDPEWDATQHPPGTPPVRWVEESYDTTTNIRRCRYNGTCPPPGNVETIPPPNGDGVTPACVTAPPTSCPTPWVQTSAPNLTCVLDAGTPPQTPPPQCPSGFTPLPPSNPDALEWNDPTHILCF